MQEYKNFEPLIQRLAKQLDAQKAASPTGQHPSPASAPAPAPQERQYNAGAPDMNSQQAGVFFGQAIPQTNFATPPAAPVAQPTAAPQPPAAEQLTQNPPVPQTPPVNHTPPVHQSPPAAQLAHTPPPAQTPPAAQLPPQPVRREMPVNAAGANDTSDDLPSLFHHHYQKVSGPLTNPARSVFVGVSSAFLLGVISLFFSPQNTPTVNKVSYTPPAKVPQVVPEERMAIFAGDTGIISAKDYLEQTDRMKRTTITLFPKQNAFEEPQKELNTAPAAPAPVVVAAAPPGVESTFSQLENSLEGLTPPPASQPAAKEKVVKLAFDAPRNTPIAAPQDKMQQLTDQVVNALSGLNQSGGGNAPALDQSVDQLRNSLANLVSEAQSQGKDPKSVERLLKEALGKNQNSLPDALKGADGKLDITTLIASVVRKSGNGRSGGGEDDYLSQIENEGQNTALTSRLVENTNGKRYLLVKSGDTLSSIAYATYGDSFLYPKIFKANKGLMANPNSLRIGMRLVIPK